MESETYEAPPGDDAGQFNIDVELARPIAVRIARRKSPLFTPFRDVEREDLIQDALLAMLRARHRYNPAKAGDGTRYRRTPDATKRRLDPRAASFCYLVGSRDVLDGWRSRSRRLAREQAVAATRPTTTAPGADDHGPDPADLAPWCADKLAQLRRRHGDQPWGAGAHVRSAAQVAVVALLLLHLRIHADGLFVLIDERRDLRQALDFHETPPRSWFRGVAKLLPRTSHAA